MLPLKVCRLLNNKWVVGNSPPFRPLMLLSNIYNRNIYFELFQTQRSGDGDLPLDQLIPPLQEVDPADALAVPEDDGGRDHIEIGLEVVQGSR